ncbi:DUF5776 domain-containing protein [Periweissella cryptocerci]|nr:DUF5776 domain-containing protein [Periweissella cryptocerci]
MFKDIIKGLLALALAGATYAYATNVHADTVADANPIRVSTSQYYTKVSAPKMAARTKLTIYQTADMKKKIGTITAGKLIKIKRLVVNESGTPTFQVSGGYITTAKAKVIVPKVTTSKKYFITKPVKVVTKAKVKSYQTVDLKTKKVLIKRNAKLTVKAISWTSKGYPSLKTNKGWVSGKKTSIKLIPKYKAHARAASAYDMTTGKFLYTKNSHKRLPNASTTKLMTLYLTYQKVADTSATWNTQVKINSHVAKMSRAPWGEIRMKPGQRWTVKQLYEAALIQSSNEAATQLGIWVAGSNAKFIKAMNQQAKTWNLKDTYYYTSTGLDNDDVAPYGLKVTGSARARNYSSAYDLTMLADKLLTKYPKILNTAKKTSAKVQGHTVKTTNKMLKGKAYYQKSLHVDGLKTGTTPAAGQVFVGTGQVPGKHRLITVVMHSSNRFADTTKIMNNVYDRYVLN